MVVEVGRLVCGSCMLYSKLECRKRGSALLDSVAVSLQKCWGLDCASVVDACCEGVVVEWEMGDVVEMCWLAVAALLGEGSVT